MTGDQTDMLARLKTVLPQRWFPDTTTILDGVLTGLANVWASLYSLLAGVRLQTRIATATDGFLDMASGDFFGSALPRLSGETDAAFRIRIDKEMIRDRATRPAVIAALTDLTGRTPAVFEYARPADTGSYNLALGYNTGGGWGSLNLPFQAQVTAYRPISPPVAIPDSDIQAAILAVLPAATTAWLSIRN
jgi:hypothetical protein